jgi:glycosyltransferase involved in cell wall biosynthesis
MTKRLKITFLLPGAGRLPTGGFKVVYEYANHLSRRGHQVTVVHPASLHEGAGLWDSAHSTLRFIKRKSDGNFTPESWFPVDSSVRLLWVRSLAEKYIPDGDVVIATAWQTAEWAARYSKSKGRRFYLLQQLETWHGMADRAEATWKAPLKKLAISQWLMDIAEGFGEAAIYLPNGLDFERFGLTNSPKLRSANNVMMLYHPGENKGFADGLKALQLAHDQIPELRATLFGIPKEPGGLPAWIQYHRCPEQNDLKELYNASAIFVSPSWTEGWGLPASEALMCGAALVATDIGGHQEYAMHEETALLAPAKDPEKLAANIMRLMRDDSLRIRLALAGNAYIQQFTWERAVQTLEAVLLDAQ